MSPSAADAARTPLVHHHRQGVGDLLGHRLRREWQHLRRHPDAVGRASGWQIVEGSLDDLDELLAAVGYGVAANPATESALRRLVTEAATDRLAARVVLQRLLPGLLALVRRRARDADQPFDELVGAAWISVTTFDPSRAPRCIAAALIDDADYRAFRRPRRRAAAGEIPTEIAADRIADVTARHPSDELADLFEIATQAGVTDADLDLLRRLLAAHRADDVAAALGVTTRTLRNRRARITLRLRELALAV